MKQCHQLLKVKTRQGFWHLMVMGKVVMDGVLCFFCFLQIMECGIFIVA
jgi:hypothetical protein